MLCPNLTYSLTPVAKFKKKKANNSIPFSNYCGSEYKYTCFTVLMFMNQKIENTIMLEII